MAESCCRHSGVPLTRAGLLAGVRMGLQGVRARELSGERVGLPSIGTGDVSAVRISRPGVVAREHRGEQKGELWAVVVLDAFFERDSGVPTPRYRSRGGARIFEALPSVVKINTSSTASVPNTESGAHVTELSSLWLLCALADDAWPCQATKHADRN